MDVTDPGSLTQLTLPFCPAQVHQTVYYWNGTQSNTSIFASGRVVGLEFNALSDLRAKKILGQSDSEKDLDTVERLKVTDFTFIDTLKHGDRPQKKLVAQEVRKVYPQAVNMNPAFVPDIYALCTSTAYDPGRHQLLITLAKKHGLLPGDRVRFLNEGGMREEEVVSVPDPSSFGVRADRDYGKVFVYGKLVKDFLFMDYDAIAILNVSATQELLGRVKGLEKANAELRTEISHLNLRNAALLSRQETITRLETDIRIIKERLHLTAGR